MTLKKNLYNIKFINDNGYSIVRENSLEPIFKVYDNELIIKNKQDAEYFCWAMNHAWHNHGQEWD